MTYATLGGYFFAASFNFPAMRRKKVNCRASIRFAALCTYLDATRYALWHFAQ